MVRLADIRYVKDLAEQQQEKELRIAEFRRDKRRQPRKDKARSACIALAASLWFLLLVHILEDMKGAGQIAVVSSFAFWSLLGLLIALELYVEWVRDWRQNITMVVKSYVLPAGLIVGFIYIVNHWIN